MLTIFSHSTADKEGFFVTGSLLYSCVWTNKVAVDEAVEAFLMLVVLSTKK